MPEHDLLSSSPLLCELLDSRLPVHVSTVGPSGRPQASMIWIERRGEELVFFSEEDTVKVRNLGQNPNVVILAVDGARMHAPGTPAYARISGVAEVRDGEPDFPDRLAVMYGNEDGYPWPLKPHRNVHVTVHRISGLGPYPTSRLGGWFPKGDPVG